MGTSYLVHEDVMAKVEVDEMSNFLTLTMQNCQDENLAVFCTEPMTPAQALDAAFKLAQAACYWCDESEFEDFKRRVASELYGPT